MISVAVILLGKIVDLLRNRCSIEQFQRIEGDFVKRFDVSLYYGGAKKPGDSGKVESPGFTLFP